MLAISLIISIPKNTEAQTCGFGCFGLSGFYGGYSYQKYDAGGLNSFIDFMNNNGNYPSTGTQLEKFKAASGFRIGANIFRFNYKNLLVSVKGYYQYLKEEHESSNKVDALITSNKFSMNLNYWGVGVDLGVSLSNSFDLKIVDAQVTFHSADLDVSQPSSSSKNIETQYKNGKSATGFSIGCGFIYKISGDYLSLETTAGYTNFIIKEMYDNKENSFLGPNNSYVSGENFISGGGLFLSAQINLGIPLY